MQLFLKMISCLTSDQADLLTHLGAPELLGVVLILNQFSLIVHLHLYFLQAAVIFEGRFLDLLQLVQ